MLRLARDAELHLGPHHGPRAWKGFDWESGNRPHEWGSISGFPRALTETRPLAYHEKVRQG
jgi:hypothetical protein